MPRSLKQFAAVVVRKRKSLTLLGILALTLAPASGWLFARLAEAQAISNNQQRGHACVAAAMLRLHWTAMAEKRDNRELSRFLADDLCKAFGQWSVIRADQGDANGAIDQYDQSAVEQLSAAKRHAANGRPKSFMQYRQDLKANVYYEPVLANSASCVTCHNNGVSMSAKPALRQDDLMAIVKVVLP